MLLFMLENGKVSMCNARVFICSYSNFLKLLSDLVVKVVAFGMGCLGIAL